MFCSLYAGALEEPKVSTFRQYNVVRAEFVVKVCIVYDCWPAFDLSRFRQVPPNLTLDEASTIPITVGTAALGLYAPKQKPTGGIGLTPGWEESGRDKYAGEPILIIGGASGVGQHGITILIARYEP